MAAPETQIQLLMLPPSQASGSAPKPPPRRSASPPPPKAKASKPKAKPTIVEKKDTTKKKADDNMSKKSTQQPPAQVNIQVIRELFEDFKNKGKISKVVYDEFAVVWKHFYDNKGNKEIKAADAKKMKTLYAEHIYKK